MDNIFKITSYYGDVSDDEKLRKKYIEDVEGIEKKFNVKLPEIKTVFIGNSSMPITTIRFVGGLELIAEESMIPYIDKKNKETIDKYFSSLNKPIRKVDYL